MTTNIFLDSILFQHSKFFKGTFASDNIPNKLRNNKKRFSIICNLSNHNEPGTHFIAIIKLKKKIYYIDPLGFECFEQNILHFLKSFNIKIYHNNKAIQGDDSNLCGYYCIFFIILFDKPEIKRMSCVKSINDKTIIKCLKKMIPTIFKNIKT